MADELSAAFAIVIYEVFKDLVSTAIAGMLTSLFCLPRNELYHWIENGLVFLCMNVSVVDFSFLP